VDRTAKNLKHLRDENLGEPVLSPTAGTKAASNKPSPKPKPSKPRADGPSHQPAEHEQPAGGFVSPRATPSHTSPPTSPAPATSTTASDDESLLHTPRRHRVRAPTRHNTCRTHQGFASIPSCRPEKRRRRTPDAQRRGELCPHTTARLMPHPAAPHALEGSQRCTRTPSDGSNPGLSTDGAASKVVQARAAARTQPDDATVDAALSTAPSGGSDQWPLTPSASMELHAAAAAADVADVADAVPAAADADSEPPAAGAFAVGHPFEGTLREPAQTAHGRGRDDVGARRAALKGEPLARETAFQNNVTTLSWPHNAYSALWSWTSSLTALYQLSSLVTWARGGCAEVAATGLNPSAPAFSPPPPPPVQSAPRDMVADVEEARALVHAAPSAGPSKEARLAKVRYET